PAAGRDARRRGAARVALQRLDRLVAAAARRRGSDDAGDGPQDSAGGDAGAPLRVAIGRLLRTAAVAGVVVTWPARSTSSPRRSATSRTFHPARPPRSAGSRWSPRRTPATPSRCSPTSARTPTW